MNYFLLKLQKLSDAMSFNQIDISSLIVILISIALILITANTGRKVGFTLAIIMGIIGSIFYSMTPDAKLLLAIRSIGNSNVLIILSLIALGGLIDFKPLLVSPRAIFVGIGASIGMLLSFLIGSITGLSDKLSILAAFSAGGNPILSLFFSNGLGLSDYGYIAVFISALMLTGLPIIHHFFIGLFIKDKNIEDKEKPIKVADLKEVVIFDTLVTIIFSLILPSISLPVIALMLGNLIKEMSFSSSSETISNYAYYIFTTIIGFAVGISIEASNLLSITTLRILYTAIISIILSLLFSLIFTNILRGITKKGNKLTALGAVPHLNFQEATDMKLDNYYNINDIVENVTEDSYDEQSIDRASQIVKDLEIIDDCDSVLQGIDAVFAASLLINILVIGVFISIL